MTIRFRLIIRFLVVILVANLLLSVVTVRHITDVLLQEVQNRVRLDLNSAQAVYDAHADRVGLFVRSAALDAALGEAIARGDLGSVGAQIMRYRPAGPGLDVLAVADPQGKVLYAEESQIRARSLSGHAVLDAALASGQQITGTEVVPRADVDRPHATAKVGTRPATADTRPAKMGTRPAKMDDPFGDSIMAIGSAAPVRGPDGRVLAYLYGVNVLGRRFEIVDTIKSQVYQNKLYQGKNVGTATIFQGDARLSTNVLTPNGLRAVGTRMSPEVREQVLVRGETYAAPAYVVNERYITAYEPIRDPAGRIIGALYVGLLEAPFAHSRNTIVLVFLATLTAATVLSLLLLFFVTKAMLRPVDRVVEMSQRIISGDLQARVGIRPAGELGVLCKAIDDMADAVAQREEQLQQVTRQQVGQSEKLAAIGRLAAGIAHEVNNPLTGILTFTHLLREKPNLDDQDRLDLDLVIRETTRVRDIVRGLLDFARERPSKKSWVDVNELVLQTTRLLRGQKAFRDIVIEERLDDGLPKVFGDENQLQQVLLNLSLNACEAMPGGGKLAITTARRGKDVTIRVADTGHGIRPEHMDRIFDPFFTTKPVGKGTGLGLSVSYGIVHQHGGELDVQSELNSGSTFRITLPIEPAEPADAAPDTRGT
jgi:two-component system, NtrC family, sensor kinase